MFKKHVMFAAVICMGLCACAWAAEQAKIEGEVVDIVGLAVKGDFGKGKAHKAEGEKNVKSGLPVGVMGEDGAVHVCVTEDMKPANETLAPMVGENVVVEGKVIYLNGCNVLVMESVKKAEKKEEVKEEAKADEGEKKDEAKEEEKKEEEKKEEEKKD